MKKEEVVCPRCDLRPTKNGKHICEMCHLSLLENKPINSVDDTEILGYHIHQILWEGCQDCGNNNFHCDAGVVEENNLKWYIIQVQCQECDVNYEQIMEVRMNESNKNKQRTHKE